MDDPRYFNSRYRGPEVLETPKLIRSITIDRCSNFTSGGANGNDINLLSQLYKARTNSEEFISLLVYSVPDLRRIPFDEAVQQEFRPTRLGEWFGPSWSTHWFHVQLRIPNEFAGEEVHFIWNADNEALIWSIDGSPLQGLTGGAGSDARHEYILTTNAQGGEIIQFYIEMACNGMFGAGNGLIGPPDPNRFFNLNELDLAVPNKRAWDLLYDFQIILGMARDLSQDSLRAAQALNTANNIVNKFIPGSDESIERCLQIASTFLNAKNGDSQHEIIALGHCHIDTGWLWPFEETIRKAARSWTSQIDLMDRYPDYKFICSQAQQYQWTWIEMDTNMPSGESLCRQFLLGQRFFEEHFGKRCKVFWLPDSFGYSSQLPQLMHLADMKYFFTQKLSWNNINKFPLTTFWWIGLDGTKALTHMAPSETYNAQCTPEELIRTVRNHRDKEHSNVSLLVYGNGDGGGGPLASMIERLRRMKNVDGLPKVEMGAPTDFYEKLERETPTLTSWTGEMYFELHRGIFTTHALCKKYNRSCEFLLRDVEILATFAHIMEPENFEYPKAELDQFWKMICLIQFHDVMSGSAIEMVYDDCLQMYTKVDMLGKQMRAMLIERLLDLDGTSLPEGKQGLAVFNTLPWTRREVIEVPLDEGLPTMRQYSAFGRTGYAIVDNVPPLGARGFTFAEEVDYEPVKVATDRNNNIVMENKFIRANFDKSGHLIALVDKKLSRSLIKPNERGNVFKMFEDIPLFWDAWDVEIYHLEKGRVVEEGSVQLLEQGPLRAALLVEKRISDTSRLRQIIVMTALSRRIDFETEVDWNENRQFLKVEFAWDIMADKVTYETQYGVVTRPTHYNTSWDSAKFEVAGHKFADISEYGYGVALLNDCKYGYAAHRNVVRLSLIRSPKAPDSNCDIGHHVFKYAIYPHEGHFIQSDVVREGYNFNVPLLNRIIPMSKAASVSKALPKFRLEDAPNVVLDAIKRAEDSSDIIIRLYEAYGGHARARLVSSIPMKSIYRCNILEDELEPVSITAVSGAGDRTFSTNLRVLDDDIVELRQQAELRRQAEGVFINVGPFQVVTLKISL
ncbi:galactose mutarotase-like domain-containing protein [Dichotomocladium elegans]|nr:galactose mutarotase-like domain-containing protein [Dichotomocladium elegans]